MRTLQRTLVFSLLALMLVPAVLAEGEEAPRFTSFDEGLAAAADRDQNVLVDFYTDWCKWCKVIDSAVFKDPKGIAYFKDKMVLTQINAEVDTALASQYKISGYPTLVLMDSKGVEIDRIVGFLETDEFIQTLEDYQNGIGTLDDLLSKAEGSDDRLLFFEIADKYKYRGGDAEATAWFSKVVEAGEAKDSLSGEARISLADMKRRAKDYGSALTMFKAIENDFSTGMFAEAACIWSGIVYRQKGDTAAAVAEFQRFMADYPESEDVEYAKGQIEKLTAPPKEEGI
jgi:thioredoxin-related protein